MKRRVACEWWHAIWSLNTFYPPIHTIPQSAENVDERSETVTTRQGEKKMYRKKKTDRTKKVPQKTLAVDN